MKYLSMPGNTFKWLMVGEVHTSVRDLCREIWELEKDLDLLQLEVGGAKVWQALRMSAFYNIARQVGILGTPHTNPIGLLNRSKHVGSFIKSALWHNPFCGEGERDILVFDHGRKVPVQGRHIDIHTHYLLEDFEANGLDYEVYERPYLNRHVTAPEAQRKHLDFIRLCSTVAERLPRSGLSREEQGRIALLEHEIRRRFQIDLHLQEKYWRYSHRFKIEHKLYCTLFDRRRPRRIYVVVSYGLAPIVKAAKDAGVEVVELQHGMLSQYHLGYSYPDVELNSLDYFPDKMLVWDQYWIDCCYWPLSQDRLDVKPNEFLQRKRTELAGVPKKHKQILVVSQGSIGPFLADFILEHIDVFREFDIIYKRHPGEYGRWNEYESLRRLMSASNVSLVENDDKPIYHYLAESQYVIGVYSTCLYEALSFDCTVAVVNLPGMEYMEDLIATGKVFRIDHVFDFAG